MILTLPGSNEPVRRGGIHAVVLKNRAYLCADDLIAALKDSDDAYVSRELLSKSFYDIQVNAQKEQAEYERLQEEAKP